jgi:uncharacterized RDD family membrane protein YckC
MSAHLEQARARGGRVTAATAAATTGEPTRSARRTPAPFRLRCGALLIDYTILILIIASATLLARLLGRGARWAGETAIALGYLVAAAAAVLNLVVLPAFTGRTVGKWVTGLRVERADGRPLSLGRACLRHLVGYPATALTFGLGFLVSAFTADGRALHDYLSGTAVMRERRGARRVLVPQKTKTAAPSRA